MEMKCYSFVNLETIYQSTFVLQFIRIFFHFPMDKLCFVSLQLDKYIARHILINFNKYIAPDGICFTTYYV